MNATQQVSILRLDRRGQVEMCFRARLYEFLEYQFSSGIDHNTLVPWPLGGVFRIEVTAIYLRVSGISVWIFGAITPFEKLAQFFDDGICID